MYAPPGSDEIDGGAAHDPRGWVKAELEPGERLLWSAPRGLKPFRVGGGVVFATVVACGAFTGSFLMLASASRSRLGDDGGIALGVSAFVIGFFFSIGVLATLNARRAERVRLAGTLYALTDRRAIIWLPEQASQGVKVLTIPRGGVTGVHRVQFPDGSGDVIFKFKDGNFPFGHAEFQVLAGLQGVAEVRRVEEQVRRTLVIPPAGASDSDDRTA